MRELYRMTNEFRVLFVEGPAGLARKVEPELIACIRDVETARVVGSRALVAALRLGRWDAVVVPTEASVRAEVVIQAVETHQPGIAVLTGSAEALLKSLRRARRMAEQRGQELNRTKSELVAREEQLRQAQKMEVIGNFAGGIAHDFNNIVMSIGGYAALLLQDWPAHQSGREDLEEIVRSTEQAQALTRQLLGFARREVHQTRHLDLGEVVRDVERLLRRSAGSSVRLDLRLKDALPVRSDANQLQQVLLNLVLNARDAMPRGGEIGIGVELVMLSAPLEGADGPVPRGSWVRLVVEDNGVGMDEDARKRALEPFFTTKPPGRGTGLGLAIVHDIVKRADGHLRLLSEPGRGARFELFFPPDTTADPEASLAVGDGVATGRTILLVEDEPSLRALVGRLLKREGYAVLSAGNAEAALDLARSHSGSLDLLLTDVVLPARNGRELADDLAKLRPGIPTLFMSGYADDVVQRAGLDLARSRVLDKPFPPEDLYECVRQALASGNAEAEAPHPAPG